MKTPYAAVLVGVLLATSTEVSARTFNDRDFYAEWYPTLSLAKLSGQALRLGPMTDCALVAGVNAGGDAGVVKYLPGLRVSWDLPWFLF